MNFACMIVGDYKGYDNELLRITSNVPFDDKVKVLTAQDLQIKRYEEICNQEFEGSEDVKFMINICF